MKHYFIVVFFVVFSFFFGIASVRAADPQGELVKASQPTVYYSYGGKRYAFPNERVFFAWYKDFSTVKTISDAELAALQLVGNVTYKPRDLVKIQTDPKVYVVSVGNYLMWVKTEDFAKQVYGDDWAKKVRDISDAEFQNYVIDKPIDNLNDYSYLAMGGTDPLLTIQMAESLAEQVPQKEGFPSLSNIGDIRFSKYGYEAKTTMSVADVDKEFSTQLTGNRLYDDTRTMTTGTVTMMMRAVNVGSSVGDTFRHRSWLYMTSSDSAVDQGVYQEEHPAIVSYSDIVFPKGIISYPRAVNQSNYSHVVISDETRYIFDTLDSVDDIVTWYKTNGPKYGWTIVGLETGFEADERYHIIGLIQKDQKKDLLLDIRDVEFAREVNVHFGELGSVIPFSLYQTTSTSNNSTPTSTVPVANPETSVQSTQSTSSQTTVSSGLPLPTHSQIFIKSDKAFMATTTLSLAEAEAWFTPKMNGLLAYSDQKTLTTSISVEDRKMVNYQTVSNGNTRLQGWWYASTTYRGEWGASLGYSDVTYPSNLLMIYPRSVAQPHYQYNPETQRITYDFNTMDAQAVVYAWYMEHATEFGWTVTNSTNSMIELKNEKEQLVASVVFAGSSNLLYATVNVRQSEATSGNTNTSSTSMTN